jgi:hypothetical protein
MFQVKSTYIHRHLYSHLSEWLFGKYPEGLLTNTLEKHYFGNRIHAHVFNTRLSFQNLTPD